MSQRRYLVARLMRVPLLLVVTASAVLAGHANGQQVCRLVPDPAQPGWQIMSCRPDVAISPSIDANFSFIDSSGDGVVDTLNLGAGAVRTRVEGGADPSRFQILTRQAIVSVRGTDWATALTDTGTEVFVVTGEVHVIDQALTSGVILSPGLGVDVPDRAEAAGEAETGDTIRPVRWGEARADALLARFPGS